MLGGKLLTMSTTTFQSPLITKEVPVCNSIVYKNWIFSKKELIGNKMMEEGNVGRRTLDHVCNTISKSAHHKEGSCLQLHLYKPIII